MEKRLGKGLGSLLGAGSDSSQEKKSASAPSQEIPLDEIRPNPRQPRQHMDPEALEELRVSIQQHGVLQPVVVRRVGSHYELILGERRCRASRMAGRKTIPAVVREDVDDDRMLELALVENVQRSDLDALERAQAFQALMRDLGLTQEQVADRVGLKRATIANHLRLLDLPPKAQEALSKGLITMGHARALAGLESRKEVLDLVALIVKKDLSVRAVEDLVRRKAQAQKPSEERPARAPWEVDLEGRLRERLGTRVSLQNAKGYRGTITLHYHSREELDRLCDVLAPRELLR